MSSQDKNLHALAHVCESCGNMFEIGDEIVVLSDGMVDGDEEYDSRNERFWHLGCFPATFPEPE